MQPSYWFLWTAEIMMQVYGAAATLTGSPPEDFPSRVILQHDADDDTVIHVLTYE